MSVLAISLFMIALSFILGYICGWSPWSKRWYQSFDGAWLYLVKGRVVAKVTKPNPSTYRACWDGRGASSDFHSDHCFAGDAKECIERQFGGVQ